MASFSSVVDILNCEGESSISDVLSELSRVAEAVHRHSSGLDAVGSHVPAPETAGPISARAVDKLVAELSTVYDVVIVDSPPVVLVPEVVEIAAGVGGVPVIVAKPDIASPDDLLHVKHLPAGDVCQTRVVLGDDRLIAPGRFGVSPPIFD